MRKWREWVTRRLDDEKTGRRDDEEIMGTGRLDDEEIWRMDDGKTLRLG